MRIYLSIAIFIEIISTVYVSCQNCPLGWQTARYNTTTPCYLFTNKIQRTWRDAQTFCEQMGGRLLQMETADERDWIYNVLRAYTSLFRTHTEWWIGMHDSSSGTFWTDRSRPNFRLFTWGESSQYDHNNECVEYYNGTLRHQSCSDKKYFVCERKRDTVNWCDAVHGWESINNKCYKVNNRPRTWDDARAECQTENGDLLSVRDAETEQVLRTFVESRRTAMWFGLRAYPADQSSTATFRWQGPQGPVLSGVNIYWDTQPTLHDIRSSNGSSACVMANNTLPGLNIWQTTNCSIRAFSVCEKSQGVCASGWVRNGNTCYQVEARHRLPWSQAKFYCQQRGATLLYIKSATTQTFINHMLRFFHSSGINSIWLGLSDNNADAGPFTWAYGQRLTIDGSTYNNLYSQTPQNRPGVMDCFTIYTDDVNGTWQFAPDCNANQTFICSISVNAPPRIPTTSAPVGPTVHPYTTASWSSDCGPFWVKDQTTGYCYQFSDSTDTWFEAQSYCQQHGAMLASINNYHEQRFLADRLFAYNAPALWLGANSLNVDNAGYRWVDRSGFGYFNWAPGEPNNNVAGSNCAEMITGGPQLGKWNDDSCNSRKGYICKKKSSDFPTTPPATVPRVPAGKVYGCPSDQWMPYKDHCFLFMGQPINWPKARTFCQAFNADLASITDENEQNFVFSQLRDHSGQRVQYWIGLTDIGSQMSFRWTDGSDVSYTTWESGEPNNYQNRPEDCISMFKKTGYWNDETCENDQSGFVCKTKRTILPASTPQYQSGGGCSQTGAVAYGYYCYVLVTKAMSWANALSECQFTGGALASIDDRYHQAFLASQISGSSKDFWIGINSDTNGTYHWTNGDALVYTAWAGSHTRNLPNMCAAMHSSGPDTGLWLDHGCSENLTYICSYPRAGFSTPTTPTTTTIVPLSCPDGWREYSGNCYKGYREKHSWFEARDKCRDLGAHLVSIHSFTEQYRAFSYRVFGGSYFYSSAHSYWIGLNDFDVEKGYRWTDGSPVDYTRWNSGEPNDGDGSDDCVEYNDRGQSWNDNNCYIAKPFVCKIQKGRKLRLPRGTPSPFVTTDCGPSPSAWKLYNGSCYFISETSGTTARMSWFDARDYCTSRGGNLASIHTEQENGFIITLNTKTLNEDLWLGLTDLGVDQYGWSDGTPLDFSRWNGNQPDDAFGSEKCGQLYAYNGHWNDNDCNEKYHFVCKRPAGGMTTGSVPTTPAITGGCPQNFAGMQNSNKCLKLFGGMRTGDRKNFTAARDDCRSKGAGFDIVSINSHLELALLVSRLAGALNDDSGVWIGLNDRNSNRKYTWQDNARLLFTNWGKSEPQRSGGDCVEVYSDYRRAGKWHNIQCSEVRAYVCEAMKDPSLPVFKLPPCSAQFSGPSGAAIGYVEDPNTFDCYKVTGSGSWSQVKAACEADGTALVSVSGVFEQAFIDTLAAAIPTPVWIGLADPQNSGTYGWTDRTQVVYTSWARGQPTFGPGEGCVASQNGYWNDTQCNNNYVGVCKQPFQPWPTIPAYPSGYCKDVTWRQFTDYCYYLSLSSRVSYAAAASDCAGRGMQVASILSKKEENFILKEVDSDLADSHNIWIGFRKLGGYFTWEDSSMTTYVNWQSSPAHGDCVVLQHQNGTWISTECSSQNGYICKTPKLPSTTQPSTISTASSTSSSTAPSTSPSSSTASTPKHTLPAGFVPIKVGTTSSKNTQGASSTVQVPQKTSPSTSPPVVIAPRVPQKQVSVTPDLSSGQIAGVIIGVLLVLVLVCAVLLVLKHRSGGSMFSFLRLKESGGFDNATYDRDLGSVNIQKDSAMTNGASSNGHSFRFSDAGDADA